MYFQNLIFLRKQFHSTFVFRLAVFAFVVIKLFDNTACEND